jgi:trimethylamine:corrinoid methyltransferase-like protein
LAEKHTLDFCMQEHWRPAILNRKSLPNWLKNGKKTVNQKLVEKALEILRTHHPEPLSPEVKTDLDQIWRASQKKSRR